MSSDRQRNSVPRCTVVCGWAVREAAGVILKNDAVSAYAGKCGTYCKLLVIYNWWHMIWSVWVADLVRPSNGYSLFCDAVCCVSRERLVRFHLSQCYSIGTGRGRCLCLSRAPLARIGQLQVSEMAMACTVVGTVAVGCFRAGSAASLWSREKVSFFSPFGAATRPQLLVTVARVQTACICATGKRCGRIADRGSLQVVQIMFRSPLVYLSN